MDFVALADECAGDVRADEPGGAGNQDFHNRVPYCAA
jgi:hypothetical protein